MTQICRGDKSACDLGPPPGYAVWVVSKHELFENCEQLWVRLDSICGDALYQADKAFVGRKKKPPAAVKVWSSRSVWNFPTVKQLDAHLAYARQWFVDNPEKFVGTDTMIEQIDAVRSRISKVCKQPIQAIFDPFA